MRIHPITCTLAVLLAACSSNPPSNSNGSSAGAAGSHTTSGGSGGVSVASGGSGTSLSGSGGSPSTSGGSTATGGTANAAGGDQGGSASIAGGSALGGSAGLAGVAGTAGAAGGPTFVQPPLVTSTAGAYWVTTGTLTEAASGTADVTVNDTATAQTWDGFGAAFNEKGWDYLGQLSEAAQQTVESLQQSTLAIDELNQVSGGLRSSISRFKLRA